MESQKITSEKNVGTRRPPLPPRNKLLQEKMAQHQARKKSLKPKIFANSPTKTERLSSQKKSLQKIIYPQIQSSKTIENQRKLKRSQLNQVECDIKMKLVLVGDGSVGKTCMLISYTKNQFPIDYVPTIFENYEATVKCGGKMVKLGLWDTAGQEEYARLRPLSYPKTDIFLICFSLMDNVSFDNAIQKWLSQINDNCPNAYKIFVGTKSDLRNQYEQICEIKKQKNNLYARQQIQKRVNFLGYKFMQCSSLDQKGLNAIFTEGMTRVLKKSQSKKVQSRGDCILI